MRNKLINNFDISADGQAIYANGGDAYHGWVSRDGGRTWSETLNLQVNGPIAVSPVGSNLVVFGAHNQLRRSTDGLQTAQTVMQNDLAIRDIVFAPSNPSVVYSETDDYVLYRSDDAGLLGSN